MAGMHLSVSSLLGGLLLAACSSAPGQQLGGAQLPNAPPGQGSQPPAGLTVTVDQGPEGLTATGEVAANVLYATVTVCTSGSTTDCEDIDHVQVDTGSTGLRILHQAMSGTAAPRGMIDPATQLPISQCAVFADGWTWGSLARADVVIGGRRIPNLVLNVIGDPASGTAPEACSSGNGPEESTVAAFGAKGILGVGVFLQDCGQFCAEQVPSSGAAPYYVCSDAGASSQSCTPTTVALSDQAWNPVALLGSDNNGLQIQLPQPPTPAATSVVGTLVPGIGTGASNGLGAATLHRANPSDGTLLTTYGHRTFSQSIIDSGSSGYFFSDATIPQCAASAPGSGFYCPGTSIAASATISGEDGVAAPVGFTVANADSLFSGNGSDAAFPDLGGPLLGSSLSAQTFDWGLPFFYGRTVYVLFEQNTVGAIGGPALGF